MGVQLKVNSNTATANSSLLLNESSLINKYIFNKPVIKKKKIRTLFLSAMPAMIAGIISLFADDAFINLDAKKYTDINGTTKTEIADYDVIIYDDCHANIKELFNDVVQPGFKNKSGVKPYRIIYTDYHEISNIKSLINSGANGIVSKFSEQDKLKEAVIRVVNKEQYYCEKIFKVLLTSTQYESLLSPREKEVLYYLQEGLTYKEIAARLSLSPKTILRHIEDMKKKLNVNSFDELLRIIKT